MHFDFDKAVNLILRYRHQVNFGDFEAGTDRSEATGQQALKVLRRMSDLWIQYAQFWQREEAKAKAAAVGGTPAGDGTTGGSPDSTGAGSSSSAASSSSGPAGETPAKPSPPTLAPDAQRWNRRGQNKVAHQSYDDVLCFYAMVLCE